MASLLDRGDGYGLAYMGSAQLQQMGTGLGVLQKPLRELYIKARKPTGSSSKSPLPVLPQRQLTITQEGLRMSYRSKPNSPLEEEFFAIPYLLLWDAVRFVLVQSPDKKDKRPRCAFEPLDNDHSRNKDNLFTPLDKKYKFLQTQQHGAIFACVLRRTKGVKALDLHAFMCASEHEALGLVRALNAAHASYNTEQNTETGVFSYSPFGKSTVRVPAGADVANFAKTPPPSVRRFMQHSNAAAVHSNQGGGVGGAALVVPKSADATNRQQAHVKNVFGQSPHHQPRQPSPHHPHVTPPPHSSNLAQQRRVFHLSQEDLMSPQQQLQISPGFEDFDLDAKSSEQNEPLYEYVGSIRKHNKSGGGIGQHLNISDIHNVKLRDKGRNDLSPTARHSVHELHNITGLSHFDPSPQHTPATAPLYAKSSKLGQGLSGPNDGRVDAISISGRSPATESEYSNAPPTLPARPYTVSPSQSRQLVRDLQEFQTRRGGEEENRGLFMRPPKSPGYLDKPPGSDRNQGPGSDKNQSMRDLNRDHHSGFGDEGQRFTNPHSRVESHYDNNIGPASQQPEVEQNQPPPPRQKPVARVPPHMKTGVRVLPDNFSIPQSRDVNQTPKSSSKERPKSGLFGSPKSPTGSTHELSVFRNQQKSSGFIAGTSTGERPRSGAFMKSPTGSLPDNTSFAASGSQRSKSQHSLVPGDFIDPKASQSKWSSSGAKKTDKSANKNLNDPSMDKKMGEKLLMSKKKDAEIASVMQNLKLDYRDAPTLTPGAPSGMNFEKSLGYFP